MFKGMCCFRIYNRGRSQADCLLWGPRRLDLGTDRIPPASKLKRSEGRKDTRDSSEWAVPAPTVCTLPRANHFLRR